MNILTTNNLTKYYGTEPLLVKALDGISLEIEQGSFTAIVGTSGSGKSTLLHILGGLDTPTSGSVCVDGQELSGMGKNELAIFRRRKIGFVFQNYNLIPNLTVYDNIVFPVGSSAKIIAGFAARALAIATLCCCPPDSSFGFRFSSDS